MKRAHRPIYDGVGMLALAGGPIVALLIGRYV